MPRRLRALVEEARQTVADADSLILEILDGCDVVPVRRGPGTIKDFIEGKIEESPFGLRFMPRGEDKPAEGE